MLKKSLLNKEFYVFYQETDKIISTVLCRSQIKINAEYKNKTQLDPKAIAPIMKTAHKIWKITGVYFALCDYRGQNTKSENIRTI